MSKKITDRPICLTGATGYIGSQIVKQLLENGYKVHGTVRDLNHKNNEFLKKLKGANENLLLFEANLLDDGIFDEAISSCEYVIHTASPYLMNVEDVYKDLIDPAVLGTENIIESCKKNPLVKKIILTSSIAAVTDSPRKNKVYTENDWNKTSTPKRNPYFYSKTQAEEKAWEITKENCNFDLVTINPGVVIGPSLIPNINNSNRFIIELIKGLYPIIMDINWAMVDVRDVARAHLNILENEEASGRYLCFNEVLDMSQLVQMIGNVSTGEFKLPKKLYKNFCVNHLIKILSYTQGLGKGSFIRTHLGNKIECDNGKIKRDLKMEFLSFEKTLRDTINDYIMWKHI